MNQNPIRSWSKCRTINAAVTATRKQRVGASVWRSSVHSAMTWLKTPLIVLVVFLLHVMVMSTTVAGESQDEGWIVLFDGQNLDAWQMSSTARWRIEEGAIALPDRTDGSLNNEDYLWTKDTYGDFVLELEFKTCEGSCNSGVFLRTADRSDPVYTGIEMQVSNSQGRAVSRGGTAGAIYDCCAPTKNTVLPPGQWNRCRVICQGPKISVEMNDQLILEMDLDRWTETGRNPDGTTNKFTRPLKEFARTGYVGFQDHGRPVWYRNVRIKRLDPN